MAWSAKLQSGAGGIANFNEWELFFDPSTQTAYKITYNVSLGGEAPDVLYHTPDNGSPLPIRATGRNRIIFLELHIPPQTSWDNVLNKIHPIARLVDGADSQAMRAQTGGAEAVKVAIKPDGATATTYFDVLHGFIDTSRAFTQDVSILNKTAYKVTVALTCKPYGYGAAFTLRNDLASSPHMIEDSNADGLADGLTHLGTPTTEISTAFYLIGGKSQSVITDAANEGVIASFSTSGSIGDTCAVKGYVNINTAAKTVICQIRNGGGVVLSTVTVPAGATRTIRGPDNDDWYEFNLTGTASATDGFQIYVYAPDTATTFLVDGLYLQTGTLTVPSGWASSDLLNNRYDPAATSAATRQQINYLDVWGIPGDVPALVKNTITIPAVARSTIIGSRHTSGIYLAGAVRHWLESDEFTTTALGLTGAWSDVVDAARTDAHYKRYTETAGAGPYTAGRATDLLTGATARAFCKAPRRVYGLIRASSTAIKFLLTASVASVSVSNSRTATGVSVSTVNVWEFADLGIINARGLLPDTVPTDADQEINISIAISGTAASVTADIDAVMFFITEPEFAIWSGAETTKAAGGSILFDGEARAIVSEGSAIYESALGGLWYMQPQTTNRLILAIMGASDAHVLADTLTLSLSIIPRTSHLLGTV